MVLLELFWSFLKIGFTSFGGLSMIPLITEEMLSHGWMTAEQVSDIVGIAEMTPGPVGLNCATFAGIPRGPICLVRLPPILACSMPSLTLCVLAAVFFAKVKDSVRVQQMMVGVRPVCLGLICAVTVQLAMTNYQPGPSFVPALLIGAADTVLLLRFHWNVPRVPAAQRGAWAAADSLKKGKRPRASDSVKKKRPRRKILLPGAFCATIQDFIS